MAKSWKYVFAFAIGFLPFLIYAEETQKVCVEKVNFDASRFTFKIRQTLEGCHPNETEMELKQHEKGAFMFVPHFSGSSPAKTSAGAATSLTSP